MNKYAKSPGSLKPLNKIKYEERRRNLNRENVFFDKAFTF